jgi:hypothetical protein
MKITEKKLANNMSSVTKKDHQIYPLVPLSDVLSSFSTRKSWQRCLVPPFGFFSPAFSQKRLGIPSRDANLAFNI